MENEGVYFILARDVGYVKIGFSTNIKRRLSDLQVGSPYAFILLAVAEGDQVREKELHERFQKYRLSGEWFAYSEELRNFVLDREWMSLNALHFLRFLRRTDADGFLEAVANLAKDTGRTEQDVCDEYLRLTELSPLSGKSASS